MNKELFVHPFALGFYAATIFTIMAVLKVWKLKWELGRMRRLLADKMEIEADAARKQKGETESLRKENEQLRIKVNALNETPDRKLQRDLEIYARAERRMLLSAPGFGPAWENAKLDSHNELAEEEAGRSAPKRLFTRLFGGSATTALPQSGSSSVENNAQGVK